MWFELCPKRGNQYAYLDPDEPRCLQDAEPSHARMCGKPDIVWLSEACEDSFSVTAIQNSNH
jgi:hypothetical protein